jgi:nicotinamide riboside transporter PnuC
MSALYWITAAVSLLGVWLNIRKHRSCFVLWIGSNASWCLADATHGLPEQASLHAVYVLLAIHGLMAWRPVGESSP